MSLSVPTLTLQSSPAMFSPVYGTNYWVFNADFSNSTADPLSAKVYADIKLLDQRLSAPNVIGNLGRFKVPNRPNDVFALNVEKQLQPFITFPYDVATSSNYDTGSSLVIVNEDLPMGGLTHGHYPRLSPEPEGMVRYLFDYGLEYNPFVSFQAIGYTIYTGVTVSRFASVGVNYFCAVGDVITIAVDSGLYQYWAGTASVLGISDNGIDTFIDTDQIPDMGPILSGASITGEIYLVRHYVNTTSGSNYCYNGVRQFRENGVDMGSLYYLHTTTTNGHFMTDWGYDSSHAIQIMPGQGERARFIVNFNDDTDTRLTARLITYDSNLNQLSQYDTKLGTTCSISGVAHSLNYTCYTLQTFDPNGTVPIVDGYYYKYVLYSGVISGGSEVLLASLWYQGLNPCSKYQNFRIKFLNRQGSWAYWNFYRDQKQVSQITRTEYTKPLMYDFNIDHTVSNYSVSKLRGQAILSTDVQETFTLNSDWITEDAYAYLQQLVTSPEAYIFYDSYTQIDGTTLTAVNIPIMITDTSYTYKTRNRENIFNLTINYKYAYSTKIQNR